MSDKETAPWMKEAAESIALAALRYRTFQMPTRIAEIIAAHCPVAVECRLPRLVDAVQKFLKHDGGPGSEDYNASEIYHARRSMQSAFGFRCPRCGETLPHLYDENCTDYRATPQVTPTLQEKVLDILDELTPQDADNTHPAAIAYQRVANLFNAEGTSEQAPQELELEQEADGRWIAELLGVAAYGPSKEEAIRNAAKVLIESGQASPTLKETLKQYGAHHIRDCDALNKWKKLPCDCGFAALIEGTSEQAREFKPYMEDHEYYDPPQAPPTPEEFPSRSQEKRIRTMRGEKKPLDPRAGTPKGTK